MSHDLGATEAGSDTPNLDFAGTTPYEDYVQADVLTHLQHLRSDDPGEMVFLVTTQVMELWFTVIVHEWETASAALRRDDIPTALDALKRSLREMAALNESWRPLSGLTPAQFNSYRGSSARAPASSRRCTGGWSSCSGTSRRRCWSRTVARPASTPSWRRRSTSRASTTRCCASSPGAATPSPPRSWTATSPRSTSRPGGRGRLDRRLRRPGDRPCRRAGCSGGRPPAADPELLRLGEVLTDVAELVWRWRNDHLTATRRAMGAKTGTGGSAGVAWLEKRAGKTVFPELWTARSHV